jgi:hypothetical protein
MPRDEVFDHADSLLADRAADRAVIEVLRC